MADPLSLLQEYAMNKRELGEVKHNGKLYYVFGDIAYPHDAKTNLGVYNKQDEYYSIESILLFWNMRDLQHTAYVRDVSGRGIASITRVQRRDLLDFLNGGALPKEANMLAPVPPHIPTSHLHADESQQHAQKQYEPERKRPRIDQHHDKKGQRIDKILEKSVEKGNSEQVRGLSFFCKFQLFLVFLLISSTIGKSKKFDSFLENLVLEGDSLKNEKNNNENNNEEEEDTIVSLPGLNFELNFKHYSGFLKVSSNHFLHYWFVTSQGNPLKDPLIFWFNGGPGCSSLDGLLSELGPYIVEEDGKTLNKNPYSWNKYASIVFIEAPAGVGYSYSSDGNTTTSDDLTSLENYEAVKQFFARHNTFRNHSVYITGESYGGVYLPTLGARIVDGQGEFPINLKGMAIGNGYMNAKMNIDTSVRFAYGHGIIDQKVWNTLEMECCRGCIDGCDLSGLGQSCGRMVEDIFEFLWHSGLNPYDLYRDCDPSPGRNSMKMEVIKRGLIPSRMLHRIYSNSTKTLRWNLKSTLHGSPSVPCLNDTALTTYMNLPEVRKAIHIPDNLGHWDICSDDITEKYQKQIDDTSPFVKKIIKAHARVLLYYGDTDMACNFMLGQEFSSKLGLKLVVGKQPWMYGHQIAGFKTIYAKGLTFVTVRGAGHMAPQWRAPQMDHVISQFLLNHPI